MPDPSLTTFRTRLTDLLLVNDLERADQLLGEVLSLYPIEDLMLEVVGPTLNDIGVAWLEERISVATEHLATNLLRQHLLMWMMTGPLPFAGIPPTVLACAPGEWHEGSLLILAVLLRRRRWPVAYLGQNVPLDDLGNLAHQVNAPAIIFVAMVEQSAAGLIDWPQHLPKVQNNKPFVGFGGRIFNEQPEWREKVPGVFLGETLRDGIQLLDKRLHTLLQPKP